MNRRSASAVSPHDAQVLSRHSSDLVLCTGLDGVIRYASPSAQRILGWSPDELVGRHVSDLWHPDDPPGAVAPTSAPSGEAITVMRRLRRPDGSYAWFESCAQLNRSVGQGDLEILSVNRDVTDRVHAMSALAQSERRWRTAFGSSPIGIAEISLEGRFRQVNPALCDFLGYHAAELLGMTSADITHEDDATAAGQALAAFRRGDLAGHRGEHRYIHVTGRVVWAVVTSVPMFDARGHLDRLLMYFVDLTDRKRAESKLEHLAHHDPLTGLLNRRGFEIELDHQVAHVARFGPGGALVLFDLDNLKAVNDRYGHAAGDRALTSVARGLQGTLRQGDSIARLGGDEFAVIVPLVDRAQAEVVAAKIVSTIRGVTTAECPTGVTASAGVALFDDAELLGPAVVAAADASMYAAKAGGRDRYVVAADPTGTGPDRLDPVDSRPFLRVLS